MGDRPTITENEKVVRPFEVKKLRYTIDEERHNSTDDGNPESWKRITHNKKVTQKDTKKKESKTPLKEKRNDNANPYKKRTYSKSSAVLIHAENYGPPMAELLRTAREKIKLNELGIIQQPRIRRAANGGTLIEIPEDQARDKANL